MAAEGPCHTAEPAIPGKEEIKNDAANQLKMNEYAETQSNKERQGEDSTWWGRAVCVRDWKKQKYQSKPPYLCLAYRVPYE